MFADQRNIQPAAAAVRGWLPESEWFARRRAAAASNRPLPGAGAALFLYHRYFFAVRTRPASDLAGFLPCIRKARSVTPYLALDIWSEGPGRCAFARFNDNYKRMNELSKDAVSWLTVGDDAEGQRIDNFLVRTLKGVPKSHIYRILRSGEVRVNKERVGPDARLVCGDVVRIPPVRLALRTSNAGSRAARP